MNRDSSVYKAIRFAMDHYEAAGAGEDGNFFFPPMEMLSILNSMNMADLCPQILIAGILYHTIEDTDVTIEMIAEQFGEEVADLIADRIMFLPGWKETTALSIERLKDADLRTKVLTLADVLTKERCMKRNVSLQGDAAWSMQAVPKEILCRYLSSIQDELYDMQFDKVASVAYWEAVELFKDLFVSFYYDREEQRIFQVSTDGEGYVIQRDNMQGKPWNESIPKNAIPVARRYAERIEDNWGEEYDARKRAEGFSFEDYYVAVKCHLRGFFQNVSENDLDKLMIANVEYIRQRYDSDVIILLEGKMPQDVFLTEGPAKIADGLEKMVGMTGNIYGTSEGKRD